MPPTSLGGRPKNAWTASRKRKLVRLYTLTTLDKEEIRRVLKAHDFDPSSSDIQKKLRALFPRDYAKDYRKYRPSSRCQMNARLDAIQSRRRSGAAVPPQCDAIEVTRDQSDMFEGPLWAFRAYPSNAMDEGPQVQTSLSDPLAGAELITPSLLLLDGSSISRSSTLSRPQAFSMFSPSIGEVQRHTSCTSEQQIIYTNRSSVPSIRSLEIRLGRRSGALTRHIAAALRCSLSDSWRSSMSSSSIFGTTQHYDGNLSQPEKEGQSIASLFFHKVSSFGLSRSSRQLDELSEDDKRIWRGLVNEKASETVGALIRKDRLWEFIQLDLRTCCKGDYRRRICDGCGRFPYHRWISDHACLPTRATKMNKADDGKDFFGSTCLHFAAASTVHDGQSLIQLTRQSANVDSRNTAGRTFIHVLFASIRELKSIPKFFDLLRHLSACGFNFGIRDVYGRTATLQLVANVRKLTESSLDIIAEILILTKHEIDTMDSFGHTIGSYLWNSCGKGVSKGQLGALLSTFPKSPNHGMDFFESIQAHSNNWSSWTEWAAKNGRPTWVDINGETVLTSLVKGWRHGEDDELHLPGIIHRLVNGGADIHARDRNGSTTLATAARRGLRPAVTALLGLGASVHSMNFKGQGALIVARSTLYRASRDGDGKLYGMILSCIILLESHGIVLHPNAEQEWNVSWLKLKHSQHAAELQVVEALMASGIY